MIGFHYSEKPLTQLHNRSQSQAHNPLKPHGLWLSFEDDSYDWKQFCDDNDFMLDRCAVKHRVVLDRSDLLVIDSLEKLYGFAKTFEMPSRFGFMQFIDWELVSRHYKGLVIAPYQHAARLNPKTQFYYGWDVSSGCVWDASAVKTIEVIKTDVEPVSG